MATNIEWTEETWNPITGCTKVSEGCRNCYAERMANRLKGRAGYPEDNPFQVTVHEDKLEQPYSWTKPRMVFVCSMGDLFHEDVPDETIAQIFNVMASATRTCRKRNCLHTDPECWMGDEHTFQILTKRPERMKQFLTEGIHEAMGEWPTNEVLGTAFEVGAWPLPNVWLGTSVENQAAADDRIPHLLNTPAAVRFVSCEPLLGPIQFDWPPSRFNDPEIDWCIVGGETGPGSRPVHPYWIKGIRDQCVEADVPFFFKGWGDWEWVTYTDKNGTPYLCITVDGKKEVVLHDGNKEHHINMRRSGKKNIAREFDGREWNQFPKGGK